MGHFAAVIFRCPSWAAGAWRVTALSATGLALAAGLALGAGAALAQDGEVLAASSPSVEELTRPSSVLELGLWYTPGDRLVGGGVDAIGSMNRGLSGIANFDLRGAQYSYLNAEDDMTRWRLASNALGLRTPRLWGEYGQQGYYRISFLVDETRLLASDSYLTPLAGAGTSSQTLPAGFVAGATTAAMPGLSASLRSLALQTTRRRIGLDLRHWVDSEWELRLRLRNDAAQGARMRGAEFGSNGGNARALLLAEPVDSATQKVDASVTYSGPGRRFVLAYHGSLFRNHVDSVTWQNPYTNAPWVGGASGLPAGFALPWGRIGVAPDNDFHQITFNGSYDLSTTSRLTVGAAHGRMTQNMPFLPYTVNAGLAALPLPRDALDGRVETRFLLTRLSMRPVRALSVVAALRYDDRANRTPMSEYHLVGGDIALQPAANADSDHIRTNLARSRRLVTWSLDADYRLPGARVVQAAWARESVHRTLSEVARTTEDSVRLGLRQGGTGAWTAQADVARMSRRGTAYLYNLPYLASYSSAAYVNALALTNGCADLSQCVRLGPLQQKFYQADRDRDRFRAQLAYQPQGPLSILARLEWQHDRYPHGDYGVVSATGWSTGTDVIYTFGPDMQATLFHALENHVTRERSRQVSGAIAAGTGDSRSDWENRFSDRTHTLGLGMRYLRLLGGRLELDVDLVLVRGRTPIETTVGALVSASQNPAGALPDLRFRSDGLSLVARYAVNRDESFRFQYLARRIRQDDWATLGVGASTLASLAGIGEVPARRTVQSLGVVFVRRFR